MHTGNTILIRAPKQKIFEAAADLSQWPVILPHYRYIHYLERHTSQHIDRHIVKMACFRSGIPIAWTSEQRIDRQKMEVHFHHLKAFTKGMDVVWTFQEKTDGVQVDILHDMRFRIPFLSPIADPIIGGFFISHVASETLKHMKLHLEKNT